MLNKESDLSEFLIPSNFKKTRKLAVERADRKTNKQLEKDKQNQVDGADG